MSEMIEMVYANQIPLQLVETLMTRMSLDPKTEPILYNQSLSNLEVVFNVGDVVQTRVIEVEEYPESYFALTMIQKKPRPVPDPEAIHIYDEDSHHNDVGPDPYQLDEEALNNPPGWVDENAPPPSYGKYVETMKKIAGLRTKPTIINEQGKRQLHPFYETALKPRTFQLGPKYNMSEEKLMFYEKLKRLSMRGFRYGYPLERITPEQEQYARESYTYDYSIENRLDFGNQELLPNPEDGKYLDYQSWEFENCMLWWRGKPFKKTIFFMEEEMKRRLSQNPEDIIYYESPRIRQGAWARYIRSIQEPDNGESNNKEMERTIRDMEREYDGMQGVQEALGTDAVGYGIPDIDVTPMYRFMDQGAFPEELQPELNKLYAKEVADKQKIAKHIHVSRKTIEAEFRASLSKLVEDIQVQARATEGLLDPSSVAEAGAWRRRRPQKRPTGSEEEDDEEDDDERRGEGREEIDPFEDPDNDLDGEDNEDDTLYPFDEKLDYWLEQDLKKLHKSMRSKPKFARSPEGQPGRATVSSAVKPAAPPKDSKKKSK